jgi:hypothetical protein
VSSFFLASHLHLRAEVVTTLLEMQKAPVCPKDLSSFSLCVKRDYSVAHHFQRQQSIPGS